ncbi:hypothetical protein CRUP_013701 [Coryphaenoides rupestris]|nr:hypothetical protein CRUP_013701 [Coryphaenoides rupestris]
MAALDPMSGSPCQPSSSSASSSSSSCTSPVGSSGGEDDSMVHAEVGLLYPMAGPALLAQCMLRAYGPLHGCHRGPPYGHATPRRRKQQMTPAAEKDAPYWERRQKNNKAARRSREKRRLHDRMMKGELVALSDENAQLRAEMLALQYHLGLARGPGKASVPSRPLSLQAPFVYPPSALFQAGGVWGHGGRDGSFLALQGMKGHGEIASYRLGADWPALAPPVTCLAGWDLPAVAAGGAPIGRPQSGYKQELLQCVPFAGMPTPPQRSDAPPQPQLSSSGDHRPGASTAQQHHHQVPPGSLLPAFSHASGASTNSTSTITRPTPESWLMPQLHPAWQAAHGALLGVGPGLPLYMAME